MLHADATVASGRQPGLPESHFWRLRQPRVTTAPGRPCLQFSSSVSISLDIEHLGILDPTLVSIYGKDVRLGKLEQTLVSMCGKNVVKTLEAAEM